ncbi:unnamed protein product [[Candida] boidinii]|nr:unnamed protein product [[Candida] boidinii]
MSSINKSGTRFVPKATQRNRPNAPPKKKITFASDKPDEIENKNNNIENKKGDDHDESATPSTSSATASTSTPAAPAQVSTEKRVNVSILKKTNYTQQQDQSSINPTGPTPIPVGEIIPDTQTAAQYENTPPIITSMPTIKTSTSITTSTTTTTTTTTAPVVAQSSRSATPSIVTTSVPTKIPDTATTSASPPAINNTPSTNKLSDIPISKANPALTTNNTQNYNKLHSMRGSVSPTSSRRSSVSNCKKTIGDFNKKDIL